MQNLTIGAIFDRVETLIETLSLGPVTAIGVTDLLTPREQIHIFTAQHRSLGLLFEEGPAPVCRNVSLITTGWRPVIHLRGLQDQYPLTDLVAVLKSLTGDPNSEADFVAKFRCLSFSKDEQTGEFVGGIDVRNTNTGQTYRLVTGNELTAEALTQGLDALIMAIPRLTPAMADDCVDAINDRMQGNRLRVVAVEIGTNFVRVQDNRGRWWDDMTVFATPEELAEEFVELLDTAGAAAHEARQLAMEVDD